MLRSSSSSSSSIIAVFVALATAACSGSPASVGDSSKNGSSGTGGQSGTNTGTGGDGIGASDAQGLFDAPSETKATPGSIYGLWGGALKDLDWTFDSRIRLSETSFTFATQCISPTGVTGAIAAISAKARIDADDIAVLESRSDEHKLGDITCRANAHPGETHACTQDDGFQTNCFILDGTQLTVYGDSPFDKMVMTKISD